MQKENRNIDSTEVVEYTNRLRDIQMKGWKQWVGPLNPYRLHINKLLGLRNLEVGCGIGRILKFSPKNIVGVDHNKESVLFCRQLGLEAFTSEEFHKLSQYSTYDTLIFSHVLEHLNDAEMQELILEYKPYLAESARVIVITPQECGFKSDASHVQFRDFSSHQGLFKDLGINLKSQYSFPFPRFMGKLFIYNEFVSVGQIE